MNKSSRFASHFLSCLHLCLLVSSLAHLFPSSHRSLHPVALLNIQLPVFLFVTFILSLSCLPAPCFRSSTTGSVGVASSSASSFGSESEKKQNIYVRKEFKSQLKALTFVHKYSRGFASNAAITYLSTNCCWNFI